MSVIKKMRKQTATYWKRLEPDQFGAFAYDTPVEIECRWDDRQDEFRDEKQQVLVSRAVVYPDREMSVGDCLLKGDLVADLDPKDAGAFEIKAFEIIPNFRATEFLYIAHC